METKSGRRRTGNTGKGGSKGFSFIEVLVACALLGIGLLGLVDLHLSSIRGLGRGRFVTGAKEIAIQRAEALATQAGDLTTLPACPLNAGDPIGCFQDKLSLAPNKACTAWLKDADVPTPAGASVAGAGTTPFRMDTVIGPHPDTVNHASALLVTVSVCWIDEEGAVEQVQARRVIVPGV
jgi:prepilin-type N-terminal cleavage/methylation domain-containing protein